MPSYEQDRAWSDRYIPAMKQLIGPHLLKISTLEEDTKEATDLIVLKADGLRIACRVRRPEYYRYRHQFTVRSHRESGAVTELEKFRTGHADWMFYGIATRGPQPLFACWSLINLDYFRVQTNLFSRYLRTEERVNHDGTRFIAYDLASFRACPPLLIASQGLEDVLRPDQLRLLAMAG